MRMLALTRNSVIVFGKVPVAIRKTMRMSLVFVGDVSGLLEPGSAVGAREVKAQRWIRCTVTVVVVNDSTARIAVQRDQQVDACPIRGCAAPIVDIRAMQNPNHTD